MTNHVTNNTTKLKPLIHLYHHFFPFSIGLLYLKTSLNVIGYFEIVDAHVTHVTKLDATETVVVGGEVVHGHVHPRSSLATILSGGVGLPDTKTKLVASVGSVIAKLAKGFISGADLCSEGRPGCKLVEVVPKPVGSGSHGSIADKRVLRVCDPECGGDLVGVEESGRAASENAEVTDVAVVGLYSILLEWECNSVCYTNNASLWSVKVCYSMTSMVTIPLILIHGVCPVSTLILTTKKVCPLMS